MNRLFTRGMLVVSVLMLICGCGEFKNTIATAQLSYSENARFENMRFLDQNSLDQGSYTVLGPVQAKSTKQSLATTTSITKKDAKRTLKIKAAKMGGNAISNLSCRRIKKESWQNELTVICQGDVLKLKSREDLAEATPKKRTTKSKQIRKPEKVLDKNVGVGWLTRYGMIITNCHIVKGHKKVSVKLPTGKKIQARVEKRDPGNDLAVLDPESRLSSYQGLPIASSMTAINSKVYTLGFPASEDLKQSPKLIKGKVNATSGFNGDPRFYLISSSLQYGYSGSPLLSPNGKVVGIVMFRDTARKIYSLQSGFSSGQHYAIKIAYLRPMLKSYTKSSSKEVQSDRDVISKLHESVFTVIAK